MEIPKPWITEAQNHRYSGAPYFNGILVGFFREGLSRVAPPITYMPMFHTGIQYTSDTVKFMLQGNVLQTCSGPVDAF